jgi:hypothetical protein
MLKMKMEIEMKEMQKKLVWVMKMELILKMKKELS